MPARRVFPAATSSSRRSLRQPEATGTEEGLSEAVQKLLRDLERLDKSLEAAAGPEELAKLHASRAEVLEQLAQNANLGGGS